MDNKVTTHDRFIKKFERDLKAHYDAGDDTRFLKTFNKYTGLSEPSELAEEMLYETLLRAGRPGELVDYSLERMNNGDGAYETHMVYMLQALSDMGNYEEVLEFSSHLLEEPIPQGFRVDILSLRQNAANKLRGMLTEMEPVIGRDEFDKMNLFQQLEFVEKITETHDFAYMNLIMEAFKETERNELQTAMLLYLRSVRANGTLTIEKCGVEMTAKRPVSAVWKSILSLRMYCRKLSMKLNSSTPRLRRLQPSSLWAMRYICTRYSPVSLRMRSLRLMLNALKKCSAWRHRTVQNRKSKTGSVKSSGILPGTRCKSII